MLARVPKDIASTVIVGTATDPDGDELLYHWLVDGAATNPASPGAAGEAPLALEDVVQQYLDVGPHTLTLVVSDGQETATDEMTLTIEIAPITIDIKPGSYPNSINLGSSGVIPQTVRHSLTYCCLATHPGKACLLHTASAAIELPPSSPSGNQEIRDISSAT